MKTDKSTESNGEMPSYSLAEYLETVPPNQLAAVTDEIKKSSNDTYSISAPNIQLHCTNEQCNGTRYFRCTPISMVTTLVSESYKEFYLTYFCSNCRRVSKTFSLRAKIESISGEYVAVFYKFGEFPIYGPPLPSKLIKLIGPDRDDFLKGRRCENQGLGIGAFIYYRRVVERQKNRIIQQIVTVSEKIGASAEQKRNLEAAITETQFSKALDMAKDSLPEILLINGHSPLRLLHSALSEGVHAMTDEQCLEMASSVRIVLIELSERLAQALKDEAELAHALSTIMKKC